MFCQISLLKPPDMAFQPGETISGVIKYAVHEPMEFEKITISLKGNGQLKVKVKNSQRNKKSTYVATENYVDTDNIVSSTKIHVPVGCYEIKFNFKIPERLPPNLDYKKNLARYTIKCRIKYYIRIKFDRPGWFSFAKHFRKEINLVSTFLPQLLIEPLIFSETKKLMRLFSRKNANVSLKATISNSHVPIGGQIQAVVEINNDSNVWIRSVESKLLEVYTFKASGHTDVKIYDDVQNTDYKSGSIHGGVIKSWPLCINLPRDIVSLQNSKLVTRDYVVRIVAQLPIPHRNVVLDIPIQIGANQLPTNALATNCMFEMAPLQPIASCPVEYEEPPPSYWEVMGESALNVRFDVENECKADNEENNGEKSACL